MGDLLSLTPYPLRSRMMRGMIEFPDRFDVDAPAVVNTVVTNAPNPPGGHYFTGAEVLGYAGVGPINDFIGQFHTITGMDFEVTISVTSCREILSDITYYIECLGNSFAARQRAAAKLESPRSN